MTPIGDLGKYRLIAELARGGMGIVYLAAVQGPAGFSKLFAVKELKPDLVRDEEFLTMFLNEARLAARLHHPNIVQTIEVDEIDGRHFIAMEYLDGCTLRRALKRFSERGGFPLKMHLSVLSEVLLGLHQAHELADYDGKLLGLVHRDMNPHNIFLTFDGQAKILDFGIAKTLDTSQRTEAGVFKGKVAYMPPEQALADTRMDRRADVYAVGVMLWEAVAGRRLWEASQDVRILTKVIQNEIPKIDDVKPDAPPALRRIVSRAMAWKRDDRYASAAEFHEDLEKYLAAARQNVSIRDIGAALAEAFADERAKTKAAIDAKLAQMRTGAHLSLRPLPMAPPSSATDLAPDSAEDSDEILIVAVDSRSSLEAAKPADSASTPSEVSGPTRTTTTVSTRDSFADVVPSRRGTALRAGAILAAVALVVGGIFYIAMREPSSRGAAPGAAIAASTPAPITSASAPPAAASIELSIRVSPENAVITVDGEPARGASVQRTFPKGPTVHQVRASAPGFATKTQDFTAERDLTMDIGLVPLGASPVTARPTAPASPTAVTSPTTTKSEPAARPIETASPYGGGR